MKKLKKKWNISLSINQLLLLLICVGSVFMGIGYASINSVAMNITGNVIAEAQEGNFITDVTYSSNKNANLDGSKINSFYQTDLSSTIQLSDSDKDSSITYEMSIVNTNSVAYEFSNISFIVGDKTYSNEGITYTLTGLEPGDVIEPGDTIPFTITFHYKDNTLADNNVLESVLNFIFEEAKESNTLYDMMEEMAVPDNIQSTNVSSSTGIDFHKSSSNSNGNGLYLHAPTQNDKYPVYYYRGSVSDNNIIFGGYCWKVVRTTETGGIKIVYNGTPISSGTKCQEVNVLAQSLNMTELNTNNNSPADVGYMYGTRYVSSEAPITGFYTFGNKVSWNGSTYTLQDTVTNVLPISSGLPSVVNKHHYTCMSANTSCSTVYYMVNTGTGNNGFYAFPLTKGKTLETAKTDMFSNNSSSKLKDAFEDFFSDSNGLLDYADRIEDTIWCNDRRTYNGGLNSETTLVGNVSYFYNYYKIHDSSYFPNLGCQNYNDQFSLKVAQGGTSGYGNNLLDYPVGSLTVDELMLAGLTASANDSNYLNLSLAWWTLSPAKHQNYNSYQYTVGADGSISETYGLVSDDRVGIRPAISLSNKVELISGTGTLSNPYIVE